MAIDLEHLRLDLPEEDFSRPDGVSRFWRFSTVVLLLGVGALVWLHWFYQPPQTNSERIPVRTHTVAFAAQTQQTAFTAGGWVEPAWPSPTHASALVNGRISLLLVVEGDDLEAGESIAMLDDAPFEAELEAAQARLTEAEQKLAQAEATLERLEAGPRDEEIEVAQAEVARAKAALARMEAGFREEDIEAAQARVREARATAEFKRARADRFKTLGNDSVVPGSKAEEYEAEAKAAEESLNAAQQELKRLLAGYREVEIEEARAAVSETERRLDLLKAGTREEVITEAEAAVAAAEAQVAAQEAAVDLAEKHVKWCDVTAPVSGRVLEILIPQGGRVTDDHAAILTIYDPNKMQVRVDIRQEQAAGLFVGQQCAIKLEARKNKPYAGEVVRIDPLANLARDTVRAKVKILEPDENLRKDMTVTVDFQPRGIVTDTGEQPLLLPKGAILKRGDKSIVFVVRGGVAYETTVELGDETDAGVIVKSGVVNGDLVASSNLAMLQDGAAVWVDEGGAE